MSTSLRRAGLVLAAVLSALPPARPAAGAEGTRPLAVAALPGDQTLDAALLARVPWRPPGGGAPAGHLARSETPDGALLFGALRAAGADPRSGRRLTYLGSESRLAPDGARLAIANHLGVLDRGAGQSDGAAADPLARLGYRLRLGAPAGSDFAYGLLFHYHGADYVTQGTGVGPDSLALRIDAATSLGDSLRVALHGGHRQSALSDAAPRHRWHAGGALTQELSPLGLGPARLQVGLGARDERDADGGAPLRLLHGTFDLSLRPLDAVDSRLALHADAAGEESAGTLARHAALRLDLSLRGTLFGRPGNAGLRLASRAEESGDGATRGQDLSLRLGLGSARGRFELTAGFGLLEEAAEEDRAVLRSDVNARLSSRPDAAAAFGLEAALEARAGAPTTRLGLHGRVRF